MIDGKAFGTLTLALSLASAVAGQGGSGAVRGRVVDEVGKPVSGATVDYDSLGAVNIGYLLPASSNSEGEFVLTGVPAGSNRVCAWKESEGYPETRVLGYADLYPPCPVVTIREGQETKDVLIRLGPRAPRVSGRIVDAQSGQPVRDVSIGVFDGEGSREFLSRGPGKEGEFKILVPFNKPFRLRATARGYEIWDYGTDGTEARAESIRMKPGETKELTIRLRPLKTTPP